MRGRVHITSIAVLVVLLLALGIFAMLGCGGATPVQPAQQGQQQKESQPQAQQPQQQQLKKVSLFIGTTPQFGSLFVAEKRGLWKEQGLDVEITVFTSGAAATEAFRAGRGDVVDAGDFPSSKMWELGGVVGIAPRAHYSEISIIVGKKEISRPSDLKGKRVATRLGATAEFFLKKYLASEKVDPKDVKILNMDPADMVVALDKGDIDAYCIWQPFGWQSLESTKDAKIITTGKGYFTEWMILSTNKEYAKANPNELRGFLAAVDKAGKWAMQNVDEASTIVAERLKMDKKAAQRMLELINWDISYTPQFRKDMDDLAEFMMEMGALKGKIDWNSYFDPSFLKMVSPDLVK